MTPGDDALDRVVAWARDPRHVVVAWEIAAATRVRALRRLGARARQARVAVRLASAHPGPAVDVSPDATVHVLDAAPDAHYVAEIGLRLPDGGFAVLARSAPIATAPAAAAADTSVAWVAAAVPTVPVAHAWSGRRVPSMDPALDGPGASDAWLG